jgi:hypothetical protein
MPFPDEWNPSQGGSFVNGRDWIVSNLGKKPGPEWSMDIIEHSKGFVPGNIRWAKKHIQIRNQKHKKLGLFSLQELRIEAKRHGYDLVKKDAVNN